MDNLLSNAVRLAPARSEVTVAAGSRCGWAWVAVRDGGPGIAAADQARVFDRFYRVRATVPGRATAGSPRPTRPDGPGLGLAIARQVVESHGGRLQLHSEVGTGSTFTIWLPDRAVARVAERDAQPPRDDPLGPR